MATLAALIGGSVFHDPRPTLEETVQLANVAGGLEVERFGCVGISRDEILTDLARQRRDGAGKLRTLESLLLDLSWHRQHGDRIVFTNGCFDILHAGHLNLLNFAKQQGDVLVVAINSDRSVRELKGDKRPILKEQERARMLSALEAVDFVVIFDGNTPARVIERITPDILIKGADWKGKVVGQDWVEQHGGEVRLMPLTDGRSTTAIIEEVLTRYQNIAEAEGDRS
jgi:D-beta-D-heptose 7-phosphate kinase/D-beta-D-heptose 1-phosphate adenosyltransferase